MQLTRTLSARSRAGLVVAVTLGAFGLMPLSAASAASTASTECANARAALAQVRQQRVVAHANLVKARKALKKAQATHRPAKAKAAKAAIERIGKRYRNLGRTVNYRAQRASFACSAPQSASRATAAGSVLGLLAVANGVDLGTLNTEQLVALLDELLPGISDDLTPGQLAALLTGFNAFTGGGVDPTDLLTVLPAAFSPTDVLALFEGLADTDLLEELASTLLGSFEGLIGGFDLPDLFNPTGLIEALTSGDLLGGLCELIPIPLLCS